MERTDCRVLLSGVSRKAVSQNLTRCTIEQAESQEEVHKPWRLSSILTGGGSNRFSEVWAPTKIDHNALLIEPGILKETNSIFEANKKTW
jgi:hypothetical protein